MRRQIFTSVNATFKEHVTAGKSITVGILIICYIFPEILRKYARRQINATGIMRASLSRCLTNPVINLFSKFLHAHMGSKYISSTAQRLTNIPKFYGSSPMCGKCNKLLRIISQHSFLSHPFPLTLHNLSSLLVILQSFLCLPRTGLNSVPA
jgi:hypothetical protein